jgi:hypothetical protein
MLRLDSRQPRTLANDEFVGKIEIGIAGWAGKAALDAGTEVAPELDRIDIGLPALAFVTPQRFRHRTQPSRAVAACCR